MNENKEIALTQTVLNYFKNRSYELEYQFVVYRAKTEEMVNTLQSEKNVLQEYARKLESENKKTKKSNGATAKVEPRTSSNSKR